MMNRRQKMKRIKPTRFVLSWSQGGERKKIVVWSRHGGGRHSDCVSLIMKGNQ